MNATAISVFFSRLSRITSVLRALSQNLKAIHDDRVGETVSYHAHCIRGGLRRLQCGPKDEMQKRTVAGSTIWPKQQPYILSCGESFSDDAPWKQTEGFGFAGDCSESSLSMLSAPRYFDCGIAPTEPSGDRKSHFLRHWISQPIHAVRGEWAVRRSCSEWQWAAESGWNGLMD